MSSLWRVSLLLIIFFIAYCDCKKKILRIRTLTCNTSGISATLDYCRLKTFNRRSHYSLAFNVTKKIDDLRINVLYERKSQSERFESFIKMDNIEFCKIVMNTTLDQYIPVVGAVCHHLIQFGNVIELCRGTSDYIVVSNITWDTLESLQILPKGKAWIKTFGLFGDLRKFYFLWWI